MSSWPMTPDMRGSGSSEAFGLLHQEKLTNLHKLLPSLTTNDAKVNFLPEKKQKPTLLFRNACLPVLNPETFT